MANEIQTLYELHKQTGNTVWLVTAVFGRYENSVVITDTFCMPWTVGEILDYRGQQYSGRKRLRVKYPWFCFEANRTKIKEGQICRPMFVVGDYIGTEFGLNRNKIFKSEATAGQYQMTVRLREPTTNYKRVPVNGHTFEGMTISMKDFLEGNVPGFGKETWDSR